MNAERVVGTVEKVNGPIVIASGVIDGIMLELVSVGELRLIGEVVKLFGDKAVIQVYEDTTGIVPGTPVYGSGNPLSVELGPGLIGKIYDGIQRPLEEIYLTSGLFIKRGASPPPLSREKKWLFKPLVKEGETITAGMVIGTVQENSRIEHKVLVPPNRSGTALFVAKEGEYTVEERVLECERGNKKWQQTLTQRWPIRNPRPISQRVPLSKPLITGQRVIDTLFPLAKGGVVAIPGGFGTGKTMTQHAIARWSDADIIIYIGCGERGNEMADILKEFPKLIDPRTGTSLMERTILIGNTSNMPVSAREASIYTGITMAEYYRDQGFHVAVMADSTSRWAEALRELSSRMEEMPAEEGYPAYLATRIAQFYERAGEVKTLSDQEGSVSVIGAVSPSGGDFSEPVTQHTKRFVRCFWGLDKQLASARHYPAISWLTSYSEYIADITEWWKERSGDSWLQSRQEIVDLLQKEVRLQQVVKLVGPDTLPDSQRFILDICTLFKNSFLQQSAFDKIDMYSTVEKQMKMLSLILYYRRRGEEAIKRGVTLIKLKKMRVLQEIVKMKFSIPNEDSDAFDKLEAKLERSIAKLEALYE